MRGAHSMRPARATHATTRSSGRKATFKELRLALQKHQGESETGAHSGNLHCQPRGRGANNSVPGKPDRGAKRRLPGRGAVDCIAPGIGKKSVQEPVRNGN